MTMKKKKLTEAEIEYYEMWAKEKEKGPLTAEETIVINHINSYSKKNWVGMRLSEDKVTSIESKKDAAQQQLERLKQKGV